MNKAVGNILLTVAGAGVGFGIGYLVAKGRYQKLADQEVQSVKDAYDRMAKTGPFATPGGAVEALVPKHEVKRILEDNGYSLDDDHIPDEMEIREDRTPEDTPYPTAEEIQDAMTRVEEATSKNLFDDPNIHLPESAYLGYEEDETDVTANPDFDSMPARDPDRPYIITVDEFMHDSGTDEADKISLLFFEEDETLCDERETVINNVEELVGLENLHHFGLGSRDRNALYVRNEKLDTYFEIIRDTRSYAEVVLGVKPQKDDKRALRMRDDDD